MKRKMKQKKQKNEKKMKCQKTKMCNRIDCSSEDGTIKVYGRTVDFGTPACKWGVKIIVFLF